METQTEIFNLPTDPRKRGRLEKLLEKFYRHNGEILSLRELIETGGYTYKKIDVQKYSTRKIELAYRLLDPPILHYAIWTDANIGIDVPKIVYDALNLPERTNHARTE